MPDYPNLHTLVLYMRSGPCQPPDWSHPAVEHVKRIRSSHTRQKGGIIKAYYTVETETGDIQTLVYDRKTLVWQLKPLDKKNGYPLNYVLAHSKASRNVASFDHRLIPYRFIQPEPSAQHAAAPDLINRMQPFRFLRSRHSMQVFHVCCRHTENLRTSRHYHYVVRTDQQRYFNLVYVDTEAIWKFIQEVDGELLFDK